MKKISIGMMLLFFSIKIWPNARLDEATLEEYLKVQKEFATAICTPGTEATYNEFFKEYNGNGQYIPTTADGSLDLKAINTVMPLFDEKWSWLQNEKEKLQNYVDFKAQQKILELITIDFEKLDKLRTQFDLENKMDEEAKVTFNSLISHLEEWRKNGSFLLSFRFPVEHLKMRAEYEKNKTNALFFFRRIIQEGCLDEDKVRSDVMSRSAFDTLYLSLRGRERTGSRAFFLTDNERVDLKYILKAFSNLLKLGPHKWEKRLSDWQKRIENSRDFYREILAANKPKNAETESRAKALSKLKEFVLKKEANTYEYWSKKSELFQSLFVLETILYNEVGLYDELVNFFRQDVSQVVINRFNDERFNRLTNADGLTKYINKNALVKERSWLNVMLKEGEFSFTYFYIPGNLQIYCPDMTRMGQSLRRENLKIAMNALNHNRSQFKALRYFSRASMVGRIEMDSIWADYTAVKEDPGVEIKSSKSIKQAYLKQHYNYFYDFTGTDGELYRALEIKGTPMVFKISDPNKFYTYRNPHLFRFFSYAK